MTEQQDPPPAAVAGHSRLIVVGMVVNTLGYLALIAGWAVDASWGWAAGAAVVLASTLALQTVPRRRRRRAGGTQPIPSWVHPVAVMIMVADLLLPGVAALNWSPGWHGVVGAVILLFNGGLAALATLRAIRDPDGS